MNSGRISSELIPLANFIKFMRIITKLEFDLKYDSTVIYNIIRRMLNKNYAEFSGDCPYYNKCEEFQNKIQVKYNKLLSENASKYIEPHKSSILSLNFENISAYAIFPNQRTYLKLNIISNGLNELVANHI
jgi:hypothetical protein